MPRLSWGPHWPPFLFVFDVATVGEHGDAFAYGYVVLSKHGQHYVEQQIAAVPIYTAQWSHLEGREARESLPDLTQGLGEYQNAVPKVQSFPGWERSEAKDSTPMPYDLRYQFAERWEHWRMHGAQLACGQLFPRNAHFLWKVQLDERVDPRHVGEVLDITSILQAMDYDPTLVYERLEHELPVGNPLADARHYATLLVRALERRDAIYNAAEGRYTVPAPEEWEKTRDHTER